MCGICGIYSGVLGPSLDTIVADMNAKLEHRGPDDRGQFTSEVCSLAMRRLAIIDLNTGHQPIFNEDENLVIVFNGEIYNYPELRNQLVNSGNHEFKTQSDTEVILHLYEEHGINTPCLLHGMFAFCIHDRKRRSLFLARDRFGEKPLYYINQDQQFAFSSELGSLISHKGIERRINYEALYYYLSSGFVPEPLTLFKDIYQLPKGHWLYWEQGQAPQIESYYAPQAKINPKFKDETIAKEAVKEILPDVVKRQIISDVPVGAFLSGGIDSSSIVAAYRQQYSGDIKTFTVRFEHAPYDESPIARAVAHHLGTNHHEFTISNGSFSGDLVWHIVKHVGQPFSDSSAIPTYLISRLIRENVKVCLSGDGGDEMFGGYDFFRWQQQIDQMSKMVPKPIIGATYELTKALSHQPAFEKMKSLRRVLRSSEIARLQGTERILAMGKIFDAHELFNLASASLRDRLDGINNKNRLLRDLKAKNDPTFLRQMMTYRLMTLSEDMLVKVDRMSMSTSLEVRAPMLDVKVAELSLQLPDELLIKGGTGKYILRQAVRDWLPDSVFNHPKKGFSIPLHMFQNKSYEQLCQELLLESSDGIGELFDRKVLEAIVEEGLTQRNDTIRKSVYRTTHQLWTLVQLAAWQNHFSVAL